MASSFHLDQFREGKIQIIQRNTSFSSQELEEDFQKWINLTKPLIGQTWLEIPWYKPPTNS